MKLEKIYIFIISLLILTLNTCGLMPDLSGERHVYYGDGITIYYPIAIRAVSPYEIQLTMADGQYLPDFMDISNFSVSYGGIKLQGVSPDMGYEVTFFVSNQIVGESYAIEIADVGFTNQTNYLFLEITNQITNKYPDSPSARRRAIMVTNTITNEYYLTNKNIIYMDGDTLFFEAYGSDDSVIPEIRMLYPLTNHIQHNVYIDGQSLHFRAFASDDIGIDRIEYKVDSRPYELAASDDFAAVFESLNIYAEGKHTVLVKAIDKVGNSKSTSFSFNLDRTIPQIWVRALKDPYIFTRGETIDIEAYSDELTLKSHELAIYTPTTNYEWISMVSNGNGNYSFDILPRLRDSGKVVLVFRTINTVEFTNLSTNTFLLYDDEAIYVSSYGNDNLGDGTINNPYREIDLAVGMAKSLSITNIHVSQGEFHGFSEISYMVLTGGYDLEFNGIAELNSVEAQMGQITIMNERCVMEMSGFNNAKVQNMQFGQGLEIASSSNFILNRIECVNSAGDALYLNGTFDVRISTSLFHNSLRGIKSIGGSKIDIVNSSLINNHYSKIFYIEGLQSSTSFSWMDQDRNNPFHNITYSRLPTTFGRFGGGLYSSSLNLMISNCLIENNSIELTIDYTPTIEWIPWTQIFFSNVGLLDVNYIYILFASGGGVYLKNVGYSTSVYDTTIINNSISSHSGIIKRRSGLIYNVELHLETADIATGAGVGFAYLNPNFSAFSFGIPRSVSIINYEVLSFFNNNNYVAYNYCRDSISSDTSQNETIYLFRENN